VLIFHLGALGDFVLSWPLAMALGRLHAQSRIIYITHGQKGALAERVVGVESMDIESGWHALYSDDPKLPERPTRMLQGAVAVYSFIAAPDDMWAANVRRISGGADVICLQPRPPVDREGHWGEYLLWQLEGRYIAHEGVRQMLRSLMERGLRRTAGTGPVLLHPGAGSPDKCWPLSHYLELAKQLKNAGRAVEMVVGEVELEQWSSADLKAAQNLLPVHRSTTLIELADLLSTASAFVGNDSGPAHLAGILGLPTFVLFGPTDPQIWRPLGPVVHTLRAHPLAGLTPAEVFVWIQSLPRLNPAERRASDDDDE
jgi:heptosyltransferase III